MKVGCRASEPDAGNCGVNAWLSSSSMLRIERDYLQRALARRAEA